jgi:SAM-dependent methyltransferase
MGNANHINYSGSAGEAYQKRVHDVTLKEYSLIAKARAKKFQRFILDTSKVLEYGAGNGWNLAELKAREKVAYDVFIDPVIPWSKYGIETCNKISEIPKNHFDSIICHHVLEHVENPFEELASLRDYLRPDGQIILFVPFETRSSYKKYNPTDKNGHIYSWNVQSFCRLIEQAGFKINNYGIKTTGLDRFSARITSRFGLPDSAYYLVRKLLQALRPDREIMVLASGTS